MAPNVLCAFYRGTIESVLTGAHHLLVWQLHYKQPQSNTKSGQNCSENMRL